VQLLGYVAVVYAFFSDKIIFGVKFQSTQIVGLVIVLTFNIGVITYRLCKQKAEEKEKEDNEGYLESTEEDDFPLIKDDYKKI